MVRQVYTVEGRQDQLIFSDGSLSAPQALKITKV